MTNLLLDQDFHDRKQLEQLLYAIAEANPGCKWTKATERMNVDKDGNILDRELPYRFVEIYKCNGSPVFEVVRSSSSANEQWNDLRKESTHVDG